MSNKMFNTFVETHSNQNKERKQKIKAERGLGIKICLTVDRGETRRSCKDKPTRGTLETSDHKVEKTSSRCKQTKRGMWRLD